MNELMIVNQIEKRLQKPSDVKVFPLTPTHRKELRELRDKNIGELKTRLRNIKELKKQEYIKKYRKDIEAELKRYQKLSKELNDDWKRIMTEIERLLKERKRIEEVHKQDIKRMILKTDYGSIPQLNFNTAVREFSTNMDILTTNIATEEFDSKYGESFKKAQEHIDQLFTMYEEAINFGDLDIVKDIYYKLKNSERFFQKVANLKV